MLCQPALAVEGKRIAFVVGIGSYDQLPPHEQLTKPPADADGVEETLTRIGFQVEKAINLTRRGFNDLWSDVLNRLREEDTFILYFSGHGVQINGQNYLLPQDVRYQTPNQQDRLRGDAISLNSLLDDLSSGDKRHPKRVVVILDACRSDPFNPSAKGEVASGGLAKLPVDPKGVFVIYSAASNKISLERLSPDDPDKYSVFTRVLLPLMERKDITIETLSSELSDQVAKLAKDAGFEQEPAYYDGIRGKFCLPGCAPTVGTGDEKPPQDPIFRIEVGMHTGRISSISVDDAGKYLVSASDDKTLRVWDLPTGQLFRVLRPPIGEGREGRMYTAAISPDGNLVAGAGSSGLEWDQSHSIYIFDRESGRMLTRITGHQAPISHVTFSPRNGLALIATLRGNEGVRFYATAKNSLGKLLGEIRDYDAASHGTSLDKEGRVATASSDGLLGLWNKDLKRLLPEPQRVPQGKRPYTVSLTPSLPSDESRIAVGYENSAEVDVFSGTDLRYLYSPDTTDINKEYATSAVSWSADGKTLYAGGTHHQGNTYLIRKWAEQGKGRWTDLPASSHPISRIVPLKTGGIAYGTEDPAFGVFDDHGTRHPFKGPVTLDYRDTRDRLLLSPDGTTVQFTYKTIKGTLLSSRFSLAKRVMEQNPSTLSTLRAPVTTAAELSVEHWKDSKNPRVNGRPLEGSREEEEEEEVSHCVAIAPDSQTALFGYVSKLLYVTHEGRTIWQKLTPAEVWSVNIAKNGQVAAAALADGTIRWYEMTKGRELLALFPQPESKRWVAWTPSGYYDASPGAERLLVWHQNHDSNTEADFSNLSSDLYRPGIAQLTLETLNEDRVVRRNSSINPRRPSIQKPKLGQQSDRAAKQRSSPTPSKSSP